MSNILPKEKKLMVLRLLVEGNSIRSATRITGIHKKTITRLLVDFGQRCDEFMSANLRGIQTDHVEIDEQWSWVSKKQGHLSDTQKLDSTIGDQYLFLGLEQKSRLIIAHTVGKRNDDTTRLFIAKLANRIVLPESPDVPMEEKPQISSDG